MRVGSWAKLLSGAGLALACSGPSLDVPSRPQPVWSVELEPRIDEQTVPLLFRGQVQHAPRTGEPWLFRGALSDYYERALKRGDVPAALRERAVPLRFWRDSDDCWLQPTAWLEANTDYALAFAGIGTLRVLRSATTPEPRARRLFPPPGSPKRSLAVVCGAMRDPLPDELKLAPSDLSLSVVPGMALPGAGCLALELRGQRSAPLVSAPLLAGALIDPAPWLPVPDTVARTATSCRAGQPFHGACLEVLDDRLLVTAEGDDLLFMLQQPRSVALVAAAGARTALLRDLTPQSLLELQGTVLSGAADASAIELSLTTTSARRHLVLNEVLANPLGPEPDSEWIELLNDSAAPASLAELWLEDSSGHVALPDGELAPGEIALLVSESFRESSLDAPIAEGLRLLRLPSLGAHGLANGGEPLLLVGREGIISRFPSLPALHAGRSLARRSPDGADDDPQNFSEHGAPGASPGAANTFDAAAGAPAE